MTEILQPEPQHWWETKARYDALRAERMQHDASVLAAMVPMEHAYVRDARVEYTISPERVHTIQCCDDTTIAPALFEPDGITHEEYARTLREHQAENNQAHTKRNSQGAQPVWHTPAHWRDDGSDWLDPEKNFATDPSDASLSLNELLWTYPAHIRNTAVSMQRGLDVWAARTTAGGDNKVDGWKLTGTNYHSDARREARYAAESAEDDPAERGGEDAGVHSEHSGAVTFGRFFTGTHKNAAMSGVLRQYNLPDADGYEYGDKDYIAGNFHDLYDKIDERVIEEVHHDVVRTTKETLPAFGKPAVNEVWYVTGARRQVIHVPDEVGLLTTEGLRRHNNKLISRADEIAQLALRSATNLHESVRLRGVTYDVFGTRGTVSPFSTKSKDLRDAYDSDPRIVRGRGELLTRAVPLGKRPKVSRTGNWAWFVAHAHTYVDSPFMMPAPRELNAKLLDHKGVVMYPEAVLNPTVTQVYTDVTTPLNARDLERERENERVLFGFLRRKFEDGIEGMTSEQVTSLAEHLAKTEPNFAIAAKRHDFMFSNAFMANAADEEDRERLVKAVQRISEFTAKERAVVNAEVLETGEGWYGMVYLAPNKPRALWLHAPTPFDAYNARGAYGIAFPQSLLASPALRMEHMLETYELFYAHIAADKAASDARRAGKSDAMVRRDIRAARERIAEAFERANIWCSGCP